MPAATSAMNFKDNGKLDLLTYSRQSLCYQWVSSAFERYKPSWAVAFIHRRTALGHSSARLGLTKGAFQAMGVLGLQSEARYIWKA